MGSSAASDVCATLRQTSSNSVLNTSTVRMCENMWECFSNQAFRCCLLLSAYGYGGEMIRSSVWTEVYCSARLHCTLGANVVMWSAWFPSCLYRLYSDWALTLHRRTTPSPSRRQWWTSLEFTGASVHLLHLPLLQDFTDYFVCFPVSGEIFLCALSTS